MKDCTEMADLLLLIALEGLHCIKWQRSLFMTMIYIVIFNVVTGKFFPIRKTNNQSLYINTKSNHSTFIRDIPNTTNKRSSDLSCNEEEYEKVKSLHETVYTKTTTIKNWHWAHNICFNLSYSENAKIDIPKTLLKLIEKHFPRDHWSYNCKVLST